MKLSHDARANAAAVVLMSAALFTQGCKPDAAVRPPVAVERTPAAPQASAPVADAGSVSGTIAFKGKAPAGTIDTSMDPACSLGAASATLPVEVYAVKNGRLANVFLYVKSGPARAMQAVSAPAQPVVMDQKGCQYVPHVVGVAAGGAVEFHNSDPTMHNVHSNATANESIDISQGPRGKPQTRQFTKPELMIPVRCNNHPWMNAYVNVSATPFFAVSDTNGHFDLRGLPPGDYVLGAVHEKMGEKTLQVTVPANGAAKADFSFAL